MPGGRLKILRVAAAMIVFSGLTAAFVDFRGAVPVAVGHELASIQLVPSLVALVAGTGLAVAALVVLGVTLLVGRVYCSAVCPLGIFQDLVTRVAGWIRGSRRLLPYRPARTWLRQVFFWGVVVAVAAGGAGLTLSLADPYSIFGRLMSDLVRPVVTLANNAVVGIGTALGSEALYRVAPPWPGVGVLAVTAAMGVLLVGLAAWRGRIYCNTFCPVGTLLGLVADRSALRLSLNKSACRKCGDCLQVCKAQCIDLRAGTIDSSRCVACYNCIGACPEQGIGYRWRWSRSPQAKVAPPAARAETAVASPPRRALLAATAASLVAVSGAGRLLAATVGGPALALKGSRAICPPGAGGVDRFLDRCTACHLCVSACPTHVLQPAFLEYGLAGLLRPRLDYRAAFCNFDCRKCAEVCPDGAIDLLALAQKQVTRIGVAELVVDKCIVKTKGTDCAACSEHCPTKAVETVPFGDNLRLPQLNPDWCIGCGACEYACPAQPTKAITVVGRLVHDQVVRRVQEKATDPRRGGAFPF